MLRQISRRSLISAAAGLTAAPAAYATTMTPRRPVPPEVAAACLSYGRALDHAIAAEDDDRISGARKDAAVDRATEAKGAMVEVMQSAGVVAAIVGGRLYIDDWGAGLTVPNGAGDGGSGMVLELDDLAGL